MKSSSLDEIDYSLNDYYKSEFIQKGQELAKSNTRKLFTLKTIWVILSRNKRSVLSDHICTDSYSNQQVYTMWTNL